MTDKPPLISAANEVEQERALNVVRYAAMTDQLAAENERIRAASRVFVAKAQVMDTLRGAVTLGVLVGLGWSIWWWAR